MKIHIDDAVAMIEQFAALARAELDRLPAEMAKLGPTDAEGRRRLDAELTDDADTRRRVEVEITAVRAKLDEAVLQRLRELRGVGGHG
jgi:hypothetical protein